MWVTAGVSPSLEAELTLQGVSDSWDQFGTHPWEKNVLWNNFFFFFFNLIQRIKSWRRRNAKEQHCGCHPLGAECVKGVTWGSSPRAAEPSLLTFLFLMDKSTGSIQEIHHARVCFSWGSLKAFYFLSLSLFPVPCSYQCCAWRARAVLIEIYFYCS